MCGAREVSGWLCPGMTQDAGRIPYVPFPPGFCGLPVRHVIHRYVATETGVIYACSGGRRPRPDDQHVRQVASERPYRPVAPDAPLSVAS